MSHESRHKHHVSPAYAGKQLARRALKQHRRGVDEAHQALEAIRQEAGTARRNMLVRHHTKDIPDGMLTEVELCVRTDQGPTPFNSIWVATQYRTEATDDASATAVSYRTQLTTVLPMGKSDDGIEMYERNLLAEYTTGTMVA